MYIKLGAIWKEIGCPFLSRGPTRRALKFHVLGAWVSFA